MKKILTEEEFLEIFGKPFDEQETKINVLKIEYFGCSLWFVRINAPEALR